MYGLTELYNSNYAVICYCVLLSCLGYVMGDITYIVFSKKSTKLRPLCVCFDFVLIFYYYYFFGVGETFSVICGFSFYFTFYYFGYFFDKLTFLLCKIKPIQKISNRIKAWVDFKL